MEDYLLDPANHNKDLHPAIGNLLNLQFTYGHDKEAEKLDDNAFTDLCLAEFIKHNNLTSIDASMFKSDTMVKADDEEDKEYSEDEDEDFDDGYTEITNNTFKVIDDSNEMYGSTLQDLIAQFHFFISPDRHVCCIDSMNLSSSTKDKLVDYLYSHICKQEDTGAMEIIFLQPGNVLNRTGVYVSNIQEEKVDSLV